MEWLWPWPWDRGLGLEWSDLVNITGRALVQQTIIASSSICIKWINCTIKLVT